MFGVARDTARRAAQALREAGLVVTIPQRGTYVLPAARSPQRRPSHIAQTRETRRPRGAIC